MHYIIHIYATILSAEALEEIDANTATPMSMPTLSPMVECSFGEEVTTGIY